MNVHKKGANDSAPLDFVLRYLKVLGVFGQV